MHQSKANRINATCTILLPKFERTWVVVIVVVIVVVVVRAPTAGVAGVIIGLAAAVVTGASSAVVIVACANTGNETTGERQEGISWTFLSE